MSDWFEDELRARFAAVVVDVPVDVRSILAEGHAAKRRRLVWLLAGLGLMVVVLAGLLGVPSLRGAVMGLMQARPPVNPLATPSVTTSASPVTSPRPSSSLVSLPRITVNRASMEDPMGPIGYSGGVQRFADDVADGNLDSIVEHCWMYAESDLRNTWADETTRRAALYAFTLSPNATATGGYWFDRSTSPTRDTMLMFEEGGAIDEGQDYACPSPRDFTPAQAALNIQRLVDLHHGTPYRPGDALAPYLVWTDATLMDDMGVPLYVLRGVTTRGGITDAQWAILERMAGKPLMFYSLGGLGDPAGFPVVLTVDNNAGIQATTDDYVLFTDQASYAPLVGAYEGAPPLLVMPDTPSPYNSAHVPTERIVVKGDVGGDPHPPVSASRVAAVQRFADDLADANLDHIVASCWSQPESDLRTMWSYSDVRRVVLGWLSGPAFVVGIGTDFAWGNSEGGIGFSASELDGTYACPNPVEFTAAQAALDVQRLVDRHAGKPAHASDTDANYPLSCSPDPGFCSPVWDQLAGYLSDGDTVKNGISAAQWALLADMAGKPLRLLPPSTLGMPDGAGLYLATPDPKVNEWVVFKDLGADGVLVVAVVRV